MHVIRLHGPWTAEIIVEGATSTQRVHLPRDWAVVAAAAREGSVALVRRFHRPTGLTGSSRVRLAIPHDWPVAGVTVNAQAVTPSGGEGDTPQRYDIAEIIRTQEAHEVRIEFEVGDRLLGTAYSVGIEIEEGEQ